MHPNSLKNIEHNAANNKAAADDRKARLLTLFEAGTKTEPIDYPNISLLCKQVGVPYYVMARWRNEDPEFKLAWKQIEETYNDAAERALMNATQHKWGVAYAISWLKAKRRDVWGDALHHTGQVAVVQFVSPIRSRVGVDPSGKLSDVGMVDVQDVSDVPQVIDSKQDTSI